MANFYSALNKTIINGNSLLSSKWDNSKMNINDEFVKSKFSVNLLEIISKHVDFLCYLHLLKVMLKISSNKFFAKIP